MGLLIVDEDKCQKDGICAKECPMAIIRLQGEGGYPALLPGTDPFCIRCGHCVAVCPQGALGHTQIPLEACPPIDTALSITETQAVQFLRSRRSVRFFQNRTVEKETVQKLIETARYAPTASNAQLLEWTVFTDRAQIKNLAGLAVDWMRSVLQKDPQPVFAPYMPLVVATWDAGHDAVLWKAPALVVASAPKQDANGMVDVALALSYLELAAVAGGLGTCWAGLLQGALLSWPPLKKEMGLPENHPHHYPMMLGYPKPKYFRLPERKAPKITWR